jgi:hypothetical protein
MPGLVKILSGEEEPMVSLQPLGTHMKSMDDIEIIHDVSEHEARRLYCRWTINAATVAYYDHLIKEWEDRYGSRHIPRKALSRQEIVDKFWIIGPIEEDK